MGDRTRSVELSLNMSFVKRPESLVSWILPPSPGVLELNTDASWNGLENLRGIGWIVRGSLGSFICFSSMKVVRLWSINRWRRKWCCGRFEVVAAFVFGLRLRWLLNHQLRWQSFFSKETEDPNSVEGSWFSRFV